MKQEENRGYQQTKMAANPKKYLYLALEYILPYSGVWDVFVFIKLQK